MCVPISQLYIYFCRWYTLPWRYFSKFQWVFSMHVIFYLLERINLSPANYLIFLFLSLITQSIRTLLVTLLVLHLLQFRWKLKWVEQLWFSYFFTLSTWGCWWDARCDKSVEPANGLTYYPFFIKNRRHANAQTTRLWAATPMFLKRYYWLNGYPKIIWENLYQH